MKTLFLALGLSFGISIYGQPQHIGAFFDTQVSDQKDGNGTITGFGFQGKYDIPVARLNGLSAVGEFRITRDPKFYLNESGNAFRSRLLARYEYSSLFAQAGVYAAHVRLANTSPTVQNGYGKSIVQPVIGGGYHFTNYVRFDITADYLYFIKGNLHASDSNGKALGIDGTSKTHRIGLNTSYEFAPKWLLLTNVSWNRSTYVRQCGYYSADICGIPHPSQGWEIQFGVGRKF